jgi:hypothetical protein
MTVAPVSPPLSGDAEASKPGNSDLLRRPPSPRSPLPESRVVRGSRFWALAGDSSDEEDEAGDLTSRPGVAVSPRSGPSAVMLGDFFEPVWQKVTGAAASVVGRRRQRFAPGGRGSWSLRPSAPSPARPCAVPPFLVAICCRSCSRRGRDAQIQWWETCRSARRRIRCSLSSPLLPPLRLEGRRRSLPRWFRRWAPLPLRWGTHDRSTAC